MAGDDYTPPDGITLHDPAPPSALRVVLDANECIGHLEVVSVRGRARIKIIYTAEHGGPERFVDTLDDGIQCLQMVRGHDTVSRPPWDVYFMRIARDIAERTACLRHKIGAVLVRDKRILTTGYNGPPAGIKHCADRGGCKRDMENIPSGMQPDLDYAVHAEMNAVVQAALHGVSTAGATLYCTHHPCSTCAKVLINAGIKRIVIADEYPGDFGRELLDEAGIPVVVMPNEETHDGK